MRIFIFLFGLLFFQNTLWGIDASVSFATFKNPTQKYVELYLFVVGKTVDYQKVDSLQYRASVEVLLTFTQEDKIVQFDKYALHSPLTTRALDFVDARRYGLENGIYELNVQITDLTDTLNVAYLEPKKVVVRYDKDSILQSDIQLVSAIKKDDTPSMFTKNGYYMEALPFNFCHKNINLLRFYNEVYDTDKYLNDDFLVTYAIEKYLPKEVGKTVYIAHKRRSPATIVPLLLQMDVSELPSGIYRLRVSIRDREQTLLSEKTTVFHRSNPFLEQTEETIAATDISNTFVADLDAQTLRYSLKGIAAITPPVEIERLNYIISSDDLDRQRRHLFAFWAKYDATDPKGAYEKYMEVVRAVDNEFKSGFGYGFETDRGHIYLKYGRPNDVVSVEDEPVAPPYEIWVYYHIDRLNQNNVKFLFYNPTYATGDYRLLHSTARGEVNNPQWQLELYKQAPDQIIGDDYLNATQIRDGLHRQAARYFNDY